MEELLAGHTLSWQGECCVSCVCVSLLWCEEHFSNHDPVLLSNWIKCDFRLCREREREGQKCVQLAVHQATCTFYKTADFGAQDGMVLSVYCTTDLSLSRSWRRAEEVEILP